MYENNQRHNLDNGNSEARKLALIKHPICFTKITFMTNHYHFKAKFLNNPV